MSSWESVRWDGRVPEEYLRNPKRLVRIDGAELEGYTPKVISFLKSWYQREKGNLVWDPERKHFRLRKP